jgi:uncharacterized protein
MKTDDFLMKIKYAVKAVDDNADIILYGSRARGDNKKDSDWDILVLTSKKRTVEIENRLRDSIYNIELEHLEPVSAIILNQNEWQGMKITPFYHNVLIEGKMI